MAKTLKTPVAQLVGALGGAQKVALRLHKSESAVRMWVTRKAVPRPVWPELIDAYPHITFDQLRALERAA